MIEKITVRNFLRLSEFQFHQPGHINLIIGENDTGKTGLLKLLYAASKSLELVSRSRHAATDAPLFKNTFSKKLDGVFQPRLTTGIGSLVTKGSRDKFSLALTYGPVGGSKSKLYSSFTESARNTVGDVSELDPVDEPFNALFIPAKEVLTAFRAIRFTREPHDLVGFDDTYLDLIHSLDIPVSRRGDFKSGLKRVNDELEALFNGEVRQTEKEERFVFFKGKQEFPMSITAEGIKKIGILATLIRNRQLDKGTVLFLDEPETALHPKAIRVLMGILVHLAGAGVQIFLTSHNYFVAKQLVISARQNPLLRITCCSLLPQANEGPVAASFSDMRDGLPANPIVDEALAMFDEEVALDLG